MKIKLIVLAVMILSVGLLNGCVGKQLTYELNTTPPQGHPVNTF